MIRLLTAAPDEDDIPYVTRLQQSPSVLVLWFSTKTPHPKSRSPKFNYTRLDAKEDKVAHKRKAKPKVSETGLYE